MLKWTWSVDYISYLNPIALRKAKIEYNFGLFECSWANYDFVSVL